MWKYKPESVECSLKTESDYSVMTSSSDDALIRVNEHHVPHIRHLKMSGWRWSQTVEVNYKGMSASLKWQNRIGHRCKQGWIKGNASFTPTLCWFPPAGWGEQCQKSLKTCFYVMWTLLSKLSNQECPDSSREVRERKSSLFHIVVQ